MPPQVVMSAQLTCTFGAAPSPLTVIPMGPPVMIEGKLAATLPDSIPMANIMPFGVCNAPTNPMGMAKPIPTPCPCVPITTGPWIPAGPVKTMIGKKPALLSGAMAMCTWAGVIQVAFPGTVKTIVS